MARHLTDIDSSDRQRLLEMMRDTLKTKQAVNAYLNHPNPSFDGETPGTLVERGEFERVLADLQALREGVYQ
jgi:hypothetical protein